LGAPALRGRVRKWHDLLAPPAAVAAPGGLADAATRPGGAPRGWRPDRLAARRAGVPGALAAGETIRARIGAAGHDARCAPRSVARGKRITLCPCRGQMAPGQAASLTAPRVSPTDDVLRADQ